MKPTPLITGLAVLFGACGFEHGALDPDGRGDTMDTNGRATSCVAVKAQAPASPSGTYVIDPDGAGADPEVTVTCDMNVDGGGWMMIFMPTTGNVQSPADYTTPQNKVFMTATQVLVAYRSDSSLTTIGDYAIMPFPPQWRAASPFAVAGTDIASNVVINTSMAVPTTVRFGNQSFNSSCSDPWVPGPWGRFCIVGTTAPFFSGFFVSAADQCTDSSRNWDTGDCATRRFTLAIR